MHKSFKKGRMALTADRMSVYGHVGAPSSTGYRRMNVNEDGTFRPYATAEQLQYALADLAGCPRSDLPDVETIENHMQKGVFTYFHSPNGQKIALFRGDGLFGIVNPHLMN